MTRSTAKAGQRPPELDLSFMLRENHRPRRPSALCGSGVKSTVWRILRDEVNHRVSLCLEPPANQNRLFSSPEMNLFISSEGADSSAESTFFLQKPRTNKLTLVRTFQTCHLKATVGSPSHEERRSSAESSQTLRIVQVHVCVVSFQARCFALNEFCLVRKPAGSRQKVWTQQVSEDLRLTG